MNSFPYPTIFSFYVQRKILLIGPWNPVVGPFWQLATFFSLFSLVFVNLIQARVTYEEATSTEEFPLAYWPVAQVSEGSFLIFHWCERAQTTMGSIITWQIVLHEKDMEKKANK